MWKDGSKVLFECKVKETGTACLTGGWVELRQDPGPGSNPGQPVLKSEAIFQQLDDKLKSKPGVNLIKLFLSVNYGFS
jgi:hypothetical protein